LPRAPWALALRRLAGHRSAMIGASLVALVLICSAAASWLAPCGYDEQFPDAVDLAPSAGHWFGLEANYRDNLSRLLYGGRVSIQVALYATAISVAIGALAGAAAGYWGGWVDEVLMRVADVFYAFPGILLALVVAAVMERRSVAVVSLALGMSGWTTLARLVRAQVLVTREEDFVCAARALGAGGGRVLFRHVLPNCLGPVVVTATLLMAGNILGEAGLGFLGISGAEPPHPSWGGMLDLARNHLRDAWWMAAYPGLAVALSVLGFNLLGDGLRDALDPRWAGRTGLRGRVDQSAAG
jgi:ABC-type dipeptide/oligopeptide/nickel transport system permease subunit